MRGASARSVGRTLRSALILAALLLRFMVPAGFMIGTAASGAPGLVLCPGIEASGHVMAMQGHRPHHDPAAHREAPCPFAALAAPALPPAPPVFLPPPPLRDEAAAVAVFAVAPEPPLAAPPPPATGPPATA